MTNDKTVLFASFTNNFKKGNDDFEIKSDDFRINMEFVG